MIFTILLGVLFLAVVFFHYLQGFFSAVISAILVVIAAVLAFSWHETIVEKLLKGQAANIAHAMVLVALFAFIYIVLRIIFDKVIPDGVTLPNIVDRVGGGLAGLVAAAFSVGIVAIAAQELPFDASVMGYTKYATQDNDAQIVPDTGGQSEQGHNYSELNSNLAGQFNEADRVQTFPIYPMGVDEMLTGLIYHLSSTGSLQGDQPLANIHPDFTQELFGQRIGIQAGAKHVQMKRLPNAAEDAVDVEGVYMLPPPDQVRIVDGEKVTVRGHPVEPPLKTVGTIKDVIVGQIRGTDITEKLQYAVPRNEKQMLLIVRITFGPDATDKKEAIRISCGAIRLVRGRSDDNGPPPTDNYPIGDLEFGKPYPMLYVDKPDDFLFVPMPTGDHRSGMDAVFLVNRSDFLTKDKTIVPGTFVEVKRLSRIDLGGKKVNLWAPDKKTDTILWHQRSGMREEWHPIVVGNHAFLENDTTGKEQKK